MKTILRRLAAVSSAQSNSLFILARTTLAKMWAGRNLARVVLAKRGGAAIAGGIVLVAVGGMFLFSGVVRAATYNFVQSSWAGGATANTAVHATNQTGWTQYSAATGVTVGATVTLPSVAKTFTDDGVISRTGSSTAGIVPTGGGFLNGTNSSTVISGSGDAAVITLSPAIGGTITAAGGNTIHTFTNSGTFTPAFSGNVNALVIGGGGGGGSGGGGGGSGGYQSNVSFAVTPQAYPITVGLGGAGGASNTAGANGGNSIFSTITSIGGGGGGARDANGSVGGSGGGGGISGLGRVGAAGTAGQGNAGGNSAVSSVFGSGGGGGSSGVGFAGTTAAGGNGGAGTSNSISGFAVSYGGGGGGATHLGGGPGGAGGVGGGGSGGATPVAGAANTGGGGGAGNSENVAAANGGSGVVIISYPTSTAVSGTFTSSVIDFGAATTFTTLSYSKTIPVNTTLTLDIRAGNTAMPDGTWSVWTTNVLSDGNIGVLSGNRYVQYRVNMGLTGSSIFPVLSKVVINSSGWAFIDGGVTGVIASPGSMGGGFLNGTTSSTTVVGVGSASAVTLLVDGTGGTITHVGGNTINTFSNNGSFSPPLSGTVNVLVVAGGGGGGANLAPSYNSGGGGGAGGYVTHPSYPVIGQAIYPVTIGMGGTGGSTGSGTNGSNSVFDAITAIGGGGGGYATAASGANGLAGGSGGGQGYINGGGGGPATQGNSGGGTGYGFPGLGSNGSTGGGAGGGAGGVGLASGAGGVGRASTISGTSITYATGGNGGVAVGGDAGAANTGNGGNGHGNAAVGNGGNGGSGIVIVSYPTPTVTSGSFTSAVIDLGGKSSGITATVTVGSPVGTTMTISVRASVDNVTWTAYSPGFSDAYLHDSSFHNYYMFTGGAPFDGSRYLQYVINFTTTNPLVTPILNDVTFSYNQYGSAGTLTSSKYDAGTLTNTFSRLAWTATGTTTTETVKFQVRSSPDGITWSNWCGPSVACAGSDYFTDANNGVALSAGHPLNTGGNDRYLQYQAFLSSGGGATPTLSAVTAQYVVNAAPELDPTYGVGGALVQQVATSTDPNWGKVTIGYSARDSDTATGTINPGFVTPSFEYSTNGGTSWSAIPAGDLLPVDTTNKAVNGTTFTTYTATWTASSTLPSTYNATMKVRVTVNDNEGANNTAQVVSALFSLDTKPPAVGIGGAILDSSTGAVTGSIIITATDNGQFQYRLCNDNTFPLSDTKGNSCAWSALGVNLASTTIAWTPIATGTPSTETVYVQLRDTLGNIAAPTIVAPITPPSFILKDVSNISIGAYWEFLSWSVFTNTTGSTFSSYKLYHSLDGISYTPLTTITDPALNYYRDTITVATSSKQYYRMVAVDTDGDTSHYTPVLADTPTGTAKADLIPPVITAVAVPAANVRNTSAQVTFTTDEIAQATVQYRVNGTIPWTTVSSVSYLTSQSTYLTALVPNTTYNVQVKAVDVSGNVSAYVPGPDFTTAGGPVITNVTVSSLNDISATIFWNTSTSSDSYVYYSQYATLATPSTAGSATLVPCIASLCQHQVTISGLTAGKQYYYYVKSTDALANASTETNNNGYYTFTTTLDTTPPVVSAITTPVVAAKQAVVVWKTDEPATSQVLYGTTSGDVSKYTTTDLTKSIYHVVTLSSQTTNAGAAGGTNELVPVTKYYFVVKSADIAGNTTTSPEQTFTTPNTGDVTIVAVSIVNTTLTGAGTITPDTTAPIISDIKATSIDSFNEAISFTTNKETVTFIDYGNDTSYGSNVGHPVLTTTHNIKLPGLTMGTTYHYRIKAIDKSGNMTTGDDFSFKTPFLSEQVSTSTVPLDDNTLLQTKIEDLVQSALPSLSAPFVTLPTVADITEHGATITWKTNVKTYGLLSYATDEEYLAKNQTYIAELSSGTDRKTIHTVSLTNLKSNTKYHIQASGYVFQKVVGKSADVIFSTKPAQIQGSIAERTKNSFTVVWTTDEPASSIVEYKDLASGVAARNTEEAMRTAHSMKVENLPSGVTYTVNISGVNKEGNTLEATTPITVTTSRDVIPPVISGFKVDNALVPGRTDRIQTIVSWKTDEPGDSIVYYEEGAGTPGDTKELANKISLTGTFIQSHSVILPNLKPGTIYRLKISSADDSGNRSSFGPRTVITPQQTQSITDVIFKNFEDSFKFLRAF